MYNLEYLLSVCFFLLCHLFLKRSLGTLLTLDLNLLNICNFLSWTAAVVDGLIEVGVYLDVFELKESLNSMRLRKSLFLSVFTAEWHGVLLIMHAYWFIKFLDSIWDDFVDWLPSNSFI